MWEDGASELTAHNPVERRLGVEVGYGFPAFGGRAALMPYSAVSLEDSDARGYRLGMRVSLGSSGLLSLETERRERPASVSRPQDHAAGHRPVLARGSHQVLLCTALSGRLGGNGLAP